MDYLLFEKIIIKRACYFSVVCIFVIFISALALKYIFKNMQQERVVFYVLNVLCIIAIIGALYLGGRTIYTSTYDLKNKAYVTYNGDFIVGNDVETRSGTCSLYIPNKKGIHLETDAYILDAGKYTGKIIYGKKTKIVLDINVNTNNTGNTGDGSPVS